MDTRTTQAWWHHSIKWTNADLSIYGFHPMTSIGKFKANRYIMLENYIIKMLPNLIGGHFTKYVGGKEHRNIQASDIAECNTCIIISL